MQRPELLSASINRNILECKEVIKQRFLQLSVVLIETYWNVKVHVGFIFLNPSGVLIETYWNVKLLYRGGIRL